MRILVRLFGDRCCAIGEPVPTAALFERRVRTWRFIQIRMGVVGMPRDEAVLGPPDQRTLVDSSRDAASSLVSNP